ncbi:MAG: hypothetical protein J7502_14210 [Flavisolibacter sp.]|nr:hypothetical protein [Flavisolibacter sp.]
MNEEILQSVLTEVLEGQKEEAISNGLLTKAVENISDRITGIEEKVSKLKITVPDPDLVPVNGLLKKHFQVIQGVIEAQPKEVRQIKQIVLFPIESHKLEFYKIVMGRFFKWATILIIALVIIFKIEHYLK